MHRRGAVRNPMRHEIGAHLIKTLGHFAARQRHGLPEGRGEPIVLFALFKHGLEDRQPDRHRDDAQPIALPEKRQPHRLFFQREGKRHDHDRARKGGDEKDRPPAVIPGQVAADGRTDCRRESH
jgi:hypothetical protein